MHAATHTTVAGICLGLLASLPTSAAEDPRLAASRELAATLQSELGSRLKQAMTAGGPVQAIDVCRMEAPAMAARLNLGASARVGRTALRVRNPANAPDAGARTVLEGFAHRLAAGETGPIEEFRTLPDGSARYMQAIVTQPMCLACHGPALAEPVRQALAKHYPADEATGFRVGEMRGAFIVDWKAD